MNFPKPAAIALALLLPAILRAAPQPPVTVSENENSFTLDNGIITFSDLSFSIPGAAILLHGTYNLRGEDLDFDGQLRMKARLSQTVTGAKSFFLKAVDPFFRKDGKTQIPIKISGTRDKPSFGLDLHRKKDDDKKDGQKKEGAQGKGK